MPKEQLNLRIDGELLKRLRAVTNREKDPYAPAMVQVVEEALRRELDRLARRKK